MRFKRARFLRSALFLACVAVFLLSPVHPVFPAEDIESLIRLGDDALSREDYEQAQLAGVRILNEDPRNLNGYKFFLIYLIATGREQAFYETVEKAKRQGVPELEVERLAAEILFVGGQVRDAAEKLYEYENKWSQAHDRSR